MFSIGIEYRGVVSRDGKYFGYGNNVVPITYLGKFSDVYNTLDLNCNFIRTHSATGYIYQFKIKNIYVNDPKFGMPLLIEAEGESYRRYNGYGYNVYKVNGMCGYILKEINY